ncbi:hypothetical protein [Mailhella sp.]|uniref:hypothetical protein n=1 Tax=Mailhella sp. TaxID=1981029 RepID=UPI003AB8EF6E
MITFSDRASRGISNADASASSFRATGRSARTSGVADSRARSEMTTLGRAAGGSNVFSSGMTTPPNASSVSAPNMPIAAKFRLRRRSLAPYTNQAGQ